MKPRITGMEVLPVIVSERTRWLFVRLSTNVGISGLGEASAGEPEVSELEKFYGLLGESLSIQAYREAGLPLAAAGGVRAAAAFSAIEQALWDIRGKLLGAPVHELLGGRLRDAIPLYANVNRMTKNRVPEGFAQERGACARRGIPSGQGGAVRWFSAATSTARSHRSRDDRGYRRHVGYPPSRWGGRGREGRLP